MGKLLSERIQAAIKAGKSEGIEPLIFEAEAASKQAVADHDAARERALDPLLSDGEIAAARKAMEDASFVQERMTKAAAVLREKLTEFKATEQKADERKIHKAAIDVRNAAAVRLKAEYPGLANKLGALLAEVVAADKVVADANRRAPSMPTIAEVERHARPHGDRIRIKSAARLIDIRLQRFDHNPDGAMTPDIWGRDNSLSANFQFNPEPTNAGEAHLTPEPRPGPARPKGALPSPVGNSKKEEAA